MAAATTALPTRGALLAAAATLLALIPMALWIGQAPLHLPILAIVATVLFAATLLHAEAGLLILVASMLLSPELALGAAGSGGLERSRDLILRTEDLVLLLVGFAWMARMAIHKDLGAVRRTRLNGLIAAYAACCLFSTLIGIQAGRVRPLVGLCYVAKSVEYFFIFFITINYVRTADQLRRLLYAVLLIASGIVAYAFWQIPTGQRPSAPFEGGIGEPNTLGGYLVLMFAVACGVSLTAETPRLRRLTGLLAGAIVPALIATLSRSSWLAFGAAMLVLLALSRNRGRLAAVTIVALVVLFLAMPHRVQQRIDYTFTPEGADAVHLGRLHLDASSSARLNSWGAALNGFLRHPLTGWGITGYGFLDAQYFRVLVELGAPGFAAFALLLVGCGLLFGSAYHTLADPLQRGLALGMLAGFAGLLAHAIGTNTFLLIRIMEPFWLLTGLLVAAMSLRDGT